jgi:hypothetical protein
LLDGGCVAFCAGWLYEIINWVSDKVLDAIGADNLLQRAQDALLGPLKLDVFDDLTAKMRAIESINFLPDVAAAAQKVIDKVPVQEVKNVSASRRGPSKLLPW